MLLLVPAMSFEKFFETYGGVGAEFDVADGYIVVLQHPVTMNSNSLVNISKNAPCGE